MKTKMLYLLVCCLFLIPGFISPLYADSKVGYINLQRLVNESKMGKAASENIKKIRKEKEEIVNSKLKEVNALKEKINKEGDKMDPDVKREKLESLNRTTKELQRLVDDAKEDIAKEDAQLVSTILEKADGVLKAVAKKQGYTIILKDSNTIGYLDPSADITDEVLKELNKKE